MGFVTGKYNTCFKSLVQGSYFGEIEIYENSSRLSSIQSFSDSHLLAISKDEYEKIMSLFPDYDSLLRGVAKCKLERINECLEKVKDLQTIKLSSEFWRLQANNIDKEEKANGRLLRSRFQRVMSTEDSARPLLKKQASVFSIIGESSSPKDKEERTNLIGEMNSQENIGLAESSQEEGLENNYKGNDMRRIASQKYVRPPLNIGGRDEEIGGGKEISRRRNRRKSQFFYNGGVKGLKNTSGSFEEGRKGVRELEGRLKRLEGITKESEKRAEEIKVSIEDMKKIIGRMRKKKQANADANAKVRPPSILLDDFLED